MALRVKAFGAKASASELAALPSKVDSKTALQHIYSILPDLTVHITGETLPAFMGMQPGGLSPLTPKVPFQRCHVKLPQATCAVDQGATALAAVLLRMRRCT